MPDLKVPADGLSQTALYTAWVRHQEGEHPRPLFTDPLATFLLAELKDHPASPAVAAFIAQMKVTSSGFPSYHVVRTRYFDDRIEEALDSGVRQVVTLAAGVDGRPTRLPCPPGTRWFELDLPDMTEFRTALVARSGPARTCERIGVAADLTTNWTVPLRAAGFDQTRPTAWLVEGVLMYLTPQECDALLAAVTALSAPGSHLFLEHLQVSMLSDQGAQVRGGLAAGWRATAHAGTDPAIGHGRSVAPVPAAWLAAATLRVVAAGTRSHGPSGRSR